MSTGVLARLTPASLRSLALLLDRCGAAPDIARLRTADVIPAELTESVSALVRLLVDELGSPRAVARTLMILAEDREREARSATRIEVVWSGPEGRAPRHRTTFAVMQQIFETFERRLLLSTYVIDVDHRADELFGGLARRMEREPALDVQLFLNVRATGNGKSAEEAVAAFRARFIERIWPGKRLPRVYFDPRSLEGDRRAVLHAKCVVADGREALVTSANFTEAAQDRNVELGLFVRGEAIAQRIEAPFVELVTAGTVRELFA